MLLWRYQCSFWYGSKRSLALIVAIFGVLIGGSAFLILAIQLRLLTIREWLMLPFGSKLLRINWKRG